MFCFASLCQAGTWEDVGEILWFPPPPAEDILLYDRVANIELENCRQQALLWQVVSPRG